MDRGRTLIVLKKGIKNKKKIIGNKRYDTGIANWLASESFNNSRETLINSVVPVHVNSYILYNRSIKNTGERPHESTILQ